jgi:hypothetical protein
MLEGLRMTTQTQPFRRAEQHEHYVQFYKADEPLLNRNVGRYLWEGLLRGDGLLVIATPERRESLAGHLGRLGADVGVAIKERQLAVLDAHETLGQFMVGGEPDADQFETVISCALQRVRPRGPNGGIRAYGEMVGVLWAAGQHEAAIRLEEYWNQLLHAIGITLFCGYPIDIFSEDLDNTNVRAVLGAHTHTRPNGSEGWVEKAVHQAMLEVLGAQADSARSAMAAHTNSTEAALPRAEGAILWLRKNLPDDAASILSRARNYYEAAQNGPA